MHSLQDAQLLAKKWVADEEGRNKNIQKIPAHAGIFSIEVQYMLKRSSHQRQWNSSLSTMCRSLK
jgi:hypothetical protein